MLQQTIVVAGPILTIRNLSAYFTRYIANLSCYRITRRITARNQTHVAYPSYQGIGYTQAYQSETFSFDHRGVLPRFDPLDCLSAVSI
jgi:hypothetical protein